MNLIERNIFAVLIIFFVAGCDGDTVVKGSKDEEARGLISQLEENFSVLSSDVSALDISIDAVEQDVSGIDLDVGNLQNRVADLEASMDEVQSLGEVEVFDSNSQRLGRLLMLDATFPLRITDSSFRGLGVTSKGYVFLFDVSESLRVDKEIVVYFESPDCIGNGYVQRPSGSNISYVQGAVFVSGKAPDLGYFYYDPVTSFQSRTAASHLSDGVCYSGVETFNMVPVFPNDPAVTGFPDTVTAPVRLR